MKKLIGLCVMGALFGGATSVLAQATPAKPASGSSQTSGTSNETRPTTITPDGDTGIWFVPTANVLRHKKWSVGLFDVNTDNGQGFTDINRFPVTFGFGLFDRAEVFASVNVITQVDRDTRPLFYTSTAAEQSTGTGGGIVPDYPLIRGGWSGNGAGDVTLGGKYNLLASRTGPLAIAARAQVRLPIIVGAEPDNTATGTTNFQVDGIVSTHTSKVELSGFGGYLVRGNPTGYELTNGIRWGVGANFFNIENSGFRVSTELFGEHYVNSSITAPFSFGEDGSLVPVTTFLRDPIVVALGLTWQHRNGFFIGGGGAWNFNMKGRDEAVGIGVPAVASNGFADQTGFQVRVGYSMGTKNRAYVAAPPPPPPPPPPAPTPTPAPPPPPPPANRPPVVQASCDPCRVELGKVATASADARDPDGDALTYRWTASNGTIANATSRQAQWTASQQPGPATLTVTVTDGKGGSATSTTTIEVAAPPRKEFNFEDVHFEFDKYSLRPDALKILDEAVATMKANPELKLQIEGHTCNIGTTEYNLALGERRARAVREYLTARGIDANRLSTVSYGEERPKYDNARNETRRLNRRAALVVRLQ